jgi:hypothetical protein
MAKKTRTEPRCSRSESCFCYTSGTRRVNIATNPMKSHECEGQHFTRTWKTQLHDHIISHKAKVVKMLW